MDHNEPAPVSLPQINDELILAARGPRNTINPRRAYHSLVEAEFSASGTVEDVATIFLSNRECPFRCLMCDLWKNTTVDRVPDGAITEQIRLALDTLPPARHIKLYNSGNFFDAQAIPRAEFTAITELVAEFDTLIVENHPKLCNESCVQFAQQCKPQLEIAMGLETSHAPTLAMLNKQMTTDDFARACEFLRKHSIRIRAFVLLKPPATSEKQGIDRAIESVKFAFDCGVSCCAVIPTRPGNGIMEQLQTDGTYSLPVLTSLETVLNETLARKRGRVFADLWDAGKFGTCSHCSEQRIERLNLMNLTQTLQPLVSCEYCE